MDFIALDFETSDNKLSPCAVGLVVVENNVITKEFHTLINPNRPFGQAQTKIHGISKKDVADAPLFSQVWSDIGFYFTRLPVVAHNASFDKNVLEKALRRYKLDALPIVYYDTMVIYNHNYPQSSARDLPSVCAALDVNLQKHHDALEDARATAQVMLVMLAVPNNAIFPSLVSGIHLDYPKSDEEEKTVKRSFNKDHEPELAATTATMDDVGKIIFDGSLFVLTGTIAGYERSVLETLIQQRGGTVRRGVTKKTNYVVTGLQDVSVVKDGDGAKSTKILQAEELRAEGHNVKIIDATAFIAALERC